MEKNFYAKFITLFPQIMNKRGLLILFFCFGFAAAQDGISGVVFDQKDHPLTNVSVLAKPSGIEQKTDENGTFHIPALTPQTLVFSHDGYAPFIIVAAVGDVVSIQLEPNQTSEDPYVNAQLSIINISDDAVTDENDALDNISGLLQSSRDVFLRTAAFEFSASFFRLRGLDTDNATVMINGLPMNKLYSGRPQWSNWGGLNDVLRNQEVSPPIAPSDHTLGGALGTTNISTRATEYRKGSRFTVSVSDRSYNYRLLASHGTGPMEKNWSAAFAVGKRWGGSGFQEGTFYDAQSLFVAVEKQWPSHSLNLTAIATPNRRGRSSPNTQEVYDLKGIAYNEYWGWQDGHKRNSRVRRTFEPIFQLNHKWSISPQTTLYTNIGFQTGEVGNSRLDYPGGANPSPAYYQKLPSYFLTQNNGPDYEGAYRYGQKFKQQGQVDWNSLYDANLTNNINKLPAAYVLYEDRNDDTQLTLNTKLHVDLNNKTTFIGLLQHRAFSSQNFAQLTDMLGATYYLNVDPYDGFQYDLNNPNSKRNVGDKMRYNYTLEASISEASLLLRFNSSRINGYAGGSYTLTHYQRDGKFKHEAYPTSSYGKSKKQRFSSGNLKGGLTYKITGKHLLQANAAWLNRAPNLRNSFSNPRETNAVVGELANRPLSNEQTLTADASYVFRSPSLNGRLTAFYAQVKDANEISFFFAEGIGGDTSSFVQEIMQGIRKQHMGLEFGVEGALSHSFKLKAAAAIGHYTYANDPQVYLTSDDFGYLNFGRAKMKNVRLASGPQEAYSLGVTFRENFWWTGLTANYFNRTYLDISPINRTHNFLLDSDGLPINNYDPDQARLLLQQEQFNPYMVVNMVLGKSWRVGNNFLGVFLSVNNLLNETYKTGGFEQSRNANYNALLEDATAEMRRFGPKYWYGRGTTYFLNSYIRF
jgi:hypothetical protein